MDICTCDFLSEELARQAAIGVECERDGSMLVLDADPSSLNLLLQRGAMDLRLERRSTG